jgi:hypothetical protein
MNRRGINPSMQRTIFRNATTASRACQLVSVVVILELKLLIWLTFLRSSATVPEDNCLLISFNKTCNLTRFVWKAIRAVREMSRMCTLERQFPLETATSGKDEVTRL